MTSSYEIALMRLVAQRLVAPDDVATSAAVSHLLAMQAQDLPGALTSIAMRTRGGTTEDVRGAFDARVLVRSWPMRGTLHVMMVEDLRWMLDLVTARPLEAARRRRTRLDLTDDDVRRAQRVAERTLTGAGLVRQALQDEWERAGVPTSGGRGYHLIATLAQQGVLCFGPFEGGEQRLVLVEEWVPQTRSVGREEAYGRLALRYFRGHGPATVRDLARWAGISLTEARTGVAVAVESLDTMHVDGASYHLDPAVPALLAQHRDIARGTFLLPGFDEVVLGYADRSATVPPEFAARVVPGGNGMFRPTVVHDGVAVGVWRSSRNVGGKAGRGAIVAEPFETFPDEVVEAITHRAARLP